MCPFFIGHLDDACDLFHSNSTSLTLEDTVSRLQNFKGWIHCVRKIHGDDRKESHWFALVLPHGEHFTVRSTYWQHEVVDTKGPHEAERRYRTAYSKGSSMLINAKKKADRVFCCFKVCSLNWMGWNEFPCNLSLAYKIHANLCEEIPALPPRRRDSL